MKQKVHVKYHSEAVFEELEARQLFSGGIEGILAENNQLDAATIQQNLIEISNWGDSFTEEGDFLIYGCNLAATEDGQSLVQSLSNLTQTDIAASDDLTGQAELGGDWDLEYKTGAVETSLALDTATQAEFQGGIERLCC